MALLAGSSAILGLGPIQNLVKETCNITISAPRATLTSIALTTTAMIVGSLLFPDKNNKADAVKEFTETENNN